MIVFNVLLWYRENLKGVSPLISCILCSFEFFGFVLAKRSGYSRAFCHSKKNMKVDSK